MNQVIKEKGKMWELGGQIDNVVGKIIINLLEELAAMNFTQMES
jgi:hypothetical protein